VGDAATLPSAAPPLSRRQTRSGYLCSRDLCFAIGAHDPVGGNYFDIGDPEEAEEEDQPAAYMRRVKWFRLRRHSFFLSLLPLIQGMSSFA
jgi:hypothetical protein